MKAIVWTKYGSPDGLQLKEVNKPTPKENEVLIRIAATTVTAGDCELRRLNQLSPFWLPLRLYFGFFRPRKVVILGQELAGTVEAVGETVRKFRKGDHVFAATGFGLGAYAEYKCLPEQGVMAVKPANLSFEEAATIPLEGLEALHFLRLAQIQPGETVLINGAGGSIGTIAVQLAKHFGADVTAVDKPSKFEMLRSIGADQVIDYTEEDFSKNGQTYDVIFDVIGKSSFSGSLKALKRHGRYLLGSPTILQRIRARWASSHSSRKVIAEMAKPSHTDLNFIKALIEAGTVRSVVDRTYPLAQIAEAHRYVETGEKKGSVVITVPA